MNENTENPKLNEEQMDQLLSAFYRIELPEELDRLPSSWPEIMHQSADEVRRSAMVTVVPSDTETGRPAGSSAARGVVVAVATLAACLTMMVLSSYNDQVSSQQTATTVEPMDRDAADAMIPVSENESGSTGVVGDDGTTLQEVDGISLESPKVPEKKKAEKSEQ